MTERMTPERLAEIDNYVATLIEDNILEVDDALPELLQALKAERERVEELEAGLRHCLDNRSVECEIDSVMIHRLLRGSDG